MADDNTAAAAAATAATAESGEAEGQTNQEVKPIVQPEAAPAPQVDWRERRISQLTARLREAEAERDRLKVMPQSAATPSAPAGTAPVVSEAELEARVEARVLARSAQAEFDRLCNEAVMAGRQAFQDFDSKTQDLQRLIDGRDPRSVAQYQTLITAAIKSGNGPAILHNLGSNLNEAARLLALPAVDMALEVARIGADLRGRRGATEDDGQPGLPSPIRPIGNRGSALEPIDPTDPDRSDKLSTAEWMRRRNEQTARARA